MAGFVPNERRFESKLIVISPSKSSPPIFVLSVGRTGTIDVTGPRRGEISGMLEAIGKASGEIRVEFGFVRGLRLCGERGGDARSSYKLGSTRTSDSDILKGPRK